MKRIVPVILSGGAGTRLWPVSVPDRPKQLQALTGGRTMLQETLLRVADPGRFAPPLLLANADHADVIAAQLDEIGIAPAALILEPVGRNTAPAIALAALIAAPDELLLVLPSDQVIADVAAFRVAIDCGAALAADQWLVTFGIRPERPETGYGYIQRGETLADGAFVAARFVEKPDRATAENYLADGRYDWNGGIFLLRADRYLAALRQHAPDILDAAEAALAGARHDGNRLLPGREAFAAARAESIDYAVMEKAEKVAVVAVAMGWSDVGSWDALYEIAGKDDTGNAISGNVLATDSADCLLRSDGPRLVTVGIHDLIVVATNDAILILPRGESQRVREAVEALGAAKSAADHGN